MRSWLVAAVFALSLYAPMASAQPKQSPRRHPA